MSTYQGASITSDTSLHDILSFIFTPTRYYIMNIKTLILLLLLTPAKLFAEDLAEDFIKKYGYKKAIAQLFVVGVPADYKNHIDSAEFKELLSNIGIGGVMINNYNLPSFELKKENDKDIAFRYTSNFIQNIVHRASKNTSYPVILYADFEGYEFSSIKYPLTTLPNPLVLASTGDTRYAYLAGRLAGYQLKSIGVDVIFGPVLDLEHSTQGFPNSSISLRAFSENRAIMIPYAQAYLDGLSEGNILAFTKHFPSYSHVYANAHKEPSVYSASSSAIKEELKSFSDLGDKFRGIMTSHLTVKNEDAYTPVTYNKKFIEKHIKNVPRLSNKIIITDDLSNMISSKQYIQERFVKFSYALSSLNAFKAGHDQLLFSHITGIGTKKHSDLTCADIKASISLIEDLITSDNRYEEQLKNSLNKILILKNDISKMKSMYPLDYEAIEVLDTESELSTLTRYLTSTYDNGVILISKGKGNNPLYNLDLPKKILIGTEDAIATYSNELGGELSFSTYKIKKNYNKKDFQNEKDKFIKQLESHQLIIMSVDSLDHRNLLDHVRIKAPHLLDRIVVFLHDTPSILNVKLMNSIWVYGNFTKDPLSYKSDIKIIKHEIEAKEYTHLPMSLGDRGIHDAVNTIPPQMSGIKSRPIVIYKTNDEKKLSHELDGYKLRLKHAEEKIKFLSSEVDKRDAISSDTIVIITPIIILLIYFISITRWISSIIRNQFSSVPQEAIKSILSYLIYIVPLLMVTYYYSKMYANVQFVKTISKFIFNKIGIEI